MQKGYEDIEIIVQGFNGKAEPYTINKSNINHYRAYTDSGTDGKSTLKTILYMAGSEKGLIMNIGYPDFKSKLDEEKVSLAGLSDEQRKLILGIVQNYRDELKEQREKMKGA